VSSKLPVAGEFDPFEFRARLDDKIEREMIGRRWKKRDKGAAARIHPSGMTFRGPIALFGPRTSNLSAASRSDEREFFADFIRTLAENSALVRPPRASTFLRKLTRTEQASREISHIGRSYPSRLNRTASPQTTKAVMMSLLRYLRDIIWRNKYASLRSEIRIYVIPA